jgi:hypothetical protein
MTFPPTGFDMMMTAVFTGGQSGRVRLAAPAPPDGCPTVSCGCKPWIVGELSLTTEKSVKVEM